MFHEYVQISKKWCTHESSLIIITAFFVIPQVSLLYLLLYLHPPPSPFFLHVLTEYFTTEELQNMSILKFGNVLNRQSTSFEALKQWNVFGRGLGYLASDCGSCCAFLCKINSEIWHENKCTNRRPATKPPAKLSYLTLHHWLAHFSSFLVHKPWLGFDSCWNLVQERTGPASKNK